MTKRAVGLAVAIFCTVCVVGVPGAFAGEAPHWMVEGKKVEAGQSWSLTGKNVLSFTLTSASLTVVCPSAIVVGEFGTAPTMEVDFSECSVEKRPDCETNSVGESAGHITVDAMARELVFLRKSEGEEGKGPLGEYIVPPEGSTSFASEEFKGSECPIKGTVTVTGSMIAEVTPAETEAEVIKVVLPKTSILTAYKWESTGEVREILAGLKAGGANIGAHGEFETLLEDSKKFGAFG